MIILVSPVQTVVNESAIVNTLLKRGLLLFHIRKYQFTDIEMATYVNAIDPDYRKQLVLHSHFHLANELGIKRMHMREEDRKQDRQQGLAAGCTLSTSVHEIATFNTLDTIWDYAFLSPVFPSISKKGYGTVHTVLDDFRLRANPHVRLVALGGIDEKNYTRVFTAGADAIALLGAVWNSSEPIQVFDTINKNIHRGIDYDVK